MAVLRQQSLRRHRSPVSAGLVASMVGLTALVGSLGLTLPAASASVTPSGHPSVVGARPAIPAGAKTLGVLSASTRLQATIALQPASATALASYATAVSTQGNTSFHRYLSTAQFAAAFGPSTSTIATVEAALHTDGLNPGAVSANHLAIKVQGTAGQFSQAFHTGFTSYRLAGGRVAYANTAAPLLPGSIASSVQSVIGLDNLYLAQPEGFFPSPKAKSAASPHVVTGGPQPCAAATAAGPANDAYTADQIESAYSFSSLYEAGDLGAGQTVALYELEPNLASDIATYQTCYGTSAPVSYSKVDGGSGSGAGSGEAVLDIEVVLSAVPKANVIVYQGPNGTANGGYDTWNAIISANHAKVVSTSWGLCEPEEGSANMQAENTLFQEASTQGQSIVDAAGDFGSESCNTPLTVTDPAGQPFVTVVGGTTLTKLGPPPVETVWNESDLGAGAGSGGISTQFAMPSYQSGAPASLNVINANSSGSPCAATTGYCREEPDLSADADPYTGYVIYYDGTWSGIGGTSAAAPLIASLLALTNASATCAGTNIGFANPALYKAAATGYSSNFYDITSGNNDYQDTNSAGLYPSEVGYDMASGLGTPNGANLPVALCGGSTGPAPVVSGIAPTSGAPAGGTRVTVTGTGFTGATAVTFGSTPATSFDVLSNTSITAVSPAQAAPYAHNVSVTTPHGKSKLVPADEFSYVIPVVTAISPSSGGPAGGTTVTVTGSSFSGATAVTFGSTAASSFKVVNDTTITAVSPAQAAPYMHHVSVTTPNGRSNLVAADEFTYVIPVVTAISPSSGGPAGGTTVTVTGTSFSGATAVTFGSTPATSFKVVNDTTITAVSPAQAAPYMHHVSVTTPNGRSNLVAADEFTYVIPVVTGISPSSGPAGGGTTVTVTGTSFTGATAVTFGSTAAISFKVVSSTTITAVSPAQAAPYMHHVSVTTPNGRSNLVAADEFTYTK